MPAKVKNGEALQKLWMDRISDALKREKKYREKGNKVVDLYEGKKADDTPFAIVYSNVETLQPALYNSTPIPIVARRFRDADPVGKAASDASTRLLKFLIDANSKDYDGFDENVMSAVLDALLTNRGVTRFKFVARDGDPYPECVYGESVRWDKFFHGYARTWKKVPWIGFEWDMTEDEVRKNFPEVELDFKTGSIVAADDDSEKREDRDELEGVNLYKVYEIWDKSTMKVMFFSAVAKKEPLRVVDDPLELPGFFPIPKPLNFMKKSSTLVPTPLYEHYRQQANELNDITNRLRALIKACRFRGMYNAAVEGIDKMLTAEDNEFVPVENVQSMGDNTGMDKLIWTIPINELVQSVQTLAQQREACKQVIYEITGISDILRGASIAYETATAQNIKNQWGTLRLRKMQKEVQRYVRDCLEIMADIAATKFETDTIVQMTGLQYLTGVQKQQLTDTINAANVQAQQVAAQTGQPPQPPQVPPQVQQALSLPTWDDIVGLLKNGISRAYRIDIETNSTIDAEASQDKQDISDLLGALSQFFQGIGPLVESGKMPFGLAKQMLLAITRRYNFGTVLEEYLEDVPDNPQPPNDPKAAAESAKAQAAAQESAAKSQLSAQEHNQKMQLGAQQFAAEQEKARMESEIQQLELQVKRDELELQRQAIELKRIQQQEAHAQKMAQIRAKAIVDHQTTENKIRVANAAPTKAEAE